MRNGCSNSSADARRPNPYRPASAHDEDQQWCNKVKLFFYRDAPELVSGSIEGHLVRGGRKNREYLMGEGEIEQQVFEPEETGSFPEQGYSIEKDNGESVANPNPGRAIEKEPR